jgi:sortase A
MTVHDERARRSQLRQSEGCTWRRPANLLDLAVQASEQCDRRGALVRVEVVLLSLGTALLLLYAGAIGYARLSQLYFDWALDRTMAARPISVREFVSDLVRPDPSVRTERDVEAAPVPARTLVTRLAAGAPLGRLRIPSIGLSVMVLEGTQRTMLALGAGHVPGTAMPGQGGNFAVAAHRDTFFRPLKDISVGDRIVVDTPYGTFTYEVASTSIVRPTQVEAIAPGTGSTLTLVTCYPFYFVGHAPERFIVSAVLLEPDRTLGAKPRDSTQTVQW